MELRGDIRNELILRPERKIEREEEGNTCWKPTVFYETFYYPYLWEGDPRVSFLLPFEVTESGRVQDMHPYNWTFFPVWVELFHEKIRNLKLAVSWWSERKAGDVWIWHWEGKYLTFLQFDAQICLLCCSRQGHHSCPAIALGLSLMQYFAGSMVVYVFFWSFPLPGMCSL